MMGTPGPPKRDPYHSHTSRDSYDGSVMGVVLGMGVPLLGAFAPKLTVRLFAPKSARSFPSTNFQGLTAMRLC